jgi:hypothetical protein
MKNTMAMICTLCLVGCAAPEGESGAQTATELSLARPRNVPAEYVATPNGYFHPDCVMELADDEQVRADGRIENSAGGVRDLFTCPHARYDRQGQVITSDGDAARPPALSGWIEDAYATSLGAVKYIHAQWNVPLAPATRFGQTDYYFTGLVNLQRDKSILQPVLGWNQLGVAGWSLASWNCCVSGTTTHSGAIAATPGGIVSATSAAPAATPRPASAARGRSFPTTGARAARRPSTPRPLACRSTGSSAASSKRTA